MGDLGIELCSPLLVGILLVLRISGCLCGLGNLALLCLSAALLLLTTLLSLALSFGLVRARGIVREQRVESRWEGAVVLVTNPLL